VRQTKEIFELETTPAKKNPEDSAPKTGGRSKRACGGPDVWKGKRGRGNWGVKREETGIKVIWGGELKH